MAGHGQHRRRLERRCRLRRRLNDEATLNVVDKAFASVQTATFEADLAQSHRVSHAEWLARPLRERAGEMLASVLGTQL